MDQLPPVSVLCVTYGRPHLLEEAIYSFLQQDYKGIKEMIILNDFDQQELRFDHPEVKIINVSKRFNSLGEKRNAAVALASYEVLFPWDDDDIFLPHRISLSVQYLNMQLGFFKQGSKALLLNGKVLEGPIDSVFHSASCYTRELFHKVRGYLPIGQAEDYEFELAVHNVLGTNFPAALHDLTEYFYIYRWGGTNSYHASWFVDKPDDSGNKRVADFIKEQVEQKEIPIGIVPLQPIWRNDYIKLNADYIRKLQGRVR